MKDKAVGQAKPGRKPKAEPSQALEGYLAPPSKATPTDGQTELLAAVEAMKPLVAALGVDEVKKIAELLG